MSLIAEPPGDFTVGKLSVLLALNFTIKVSDFTLNAHKSVSSIGWGELLIIAHLLSLASLWPKSLLDTQGWIGTRELR